MVCFFRRNPPAPPAPKPEPRKATAENPFGDSDVWISAGDDLLMRARKIVWMMGYRGAVGGYVLDVFTILRKYETLDQELKAPTLPPVKAGGGSQTGS